MASPPFDIDQNTPADNSHVRLYPQNERAFRDVVESWLTTMSDAASGYGKIPMDTTANLAALSPQPAVGGMRYDTTVNSLQVKTGSSTWTNVGFPAGTLAIFLQETAPLGWTKVTDTEVDEAMIELTTGLVGGDYVGTTGFRHATLTQGMFPSVNFAVTGSTGSDGAHTHNGVTGSDGTHGHPFRYDPTNGSDGDTTGGFLLSDAADQNAASFTGTPTATPGQQIGGDGAHQHGFTTGSAGTHSHAITGNAASGGSGDALHTAVKRVRAILCSKD